MGSFIQGNTYYHYAYPKEEFDRDFKLMRNLGIHYVRTAEIWPGWSVIERQEGQYDFEELDVFVRTAGENGIKICMGIGINDTPFWLYYKYHDLKMRDTDGKYSKRRVQSACFDHMDYRKHIEAFISQVVMHYDKNPVVESFQIGNETRYNVPICDCNSTRKRFREWLKREYGGDINKINEEWGVFYQSFEEIYPYGSCEGAPSKGITPHYLKSRAYQNWSIEELIRSSADIVKKYSSKPVFHNSYGTPNMMGSHYEIAKPCDIVVIDIYSTTYREPGYYQGLILDFSRTIAKIQQKDLWIGETPAGQYGTFKRVFVNPDMMEACIFDLISSGAKAVFYFRHRAPKYEQPHKFTGSQTFFRRDETELMYAKIPRKVMHWMDLYENRVLKSKTSDTDILLYYPTENIWLGKEAGYESESILSVYGAKSILSASGYMADIMDEAMILEHGIDSYQVLVIPVTFLISSNLGNKIKEFVRKGGTLICEGRPAYVNSDGWLYEKQPGAGLDEVFGVREDMYFNVSKDFPVTVELDNICLSGYGTYLEQTYELNGGKAFMKDGDGEICGVFHKYGAGTAYLIGTAPSLFFSMGTGKYDSDIENGNQAQINAKRDVFINLYKEIIRSSGVEPIINTGETHNNLSVRKMENEDEEIIFITNFSKLSGAEIKTGIGWTMMTVDGEKTCPEQITVKPLSNLIISRRKTDEKE